MDPISEIPNLVRYLILIDVLPGDYRYRLIGSEVVARTGRDATGESVDHGRHVSSVISPWIDALDAVVRDQKPRALRSHLDERGATILTLILPLVSPDGQTMMILCGCFFDGMHDTPSCPNAVEPVELPVLPAAKDAEGGRRAGRPAEPLTVT